MSTWIFAERYQLRVLETPHEMGTAEDLQRQVWPGNETEIVPGHLLITSAKNGGLVIGAYDLQTAGDESQPGSASEARLRPFSLATKQAESACFNQCSVL